MSGLYSLLSSNSDTRTVQRLKKELSAINTSANMQYRAIRQQEALVQLEPLRIHEFQSSRAASEPL